jgi:hypothetical protein
MNRFYAGSCGVVDMNSNPPVEWDHLLDVAHDYWNSIDMLEVLHETSCDAGQTEQYVQDLLAVIAQKGLPARPVGIMQHRDQGLDPSYGARQAASLGYIGIEAYFPYGWTAQQTDNDIATAKANVPAGKDILLVGQAFDRAVTPLCTGGPGDDPGCGTIWPSPTCPSATDWRCHMDELVALQDRVYLAA